MAVAVKKYNPGFLTDDEIIASFCVRTAEFDSLVESLREIDDRSSPHSLVIGPRGSGKTHLLLRVAAEVRRNPALTGLTPITFAEESYEVTTCGEFWLECLGRLADQAPGKERDNLRLSYEELRTVTDDQALIDRCIGSLLDFADRHETRLVLIVENLNMLFSDIGDPDVGWQLRQTLQTEPRIILLGSATSRFDEIDNPEHALYDLFRVITLRPLDTDECTTLWKSVAGKSSTTEAVRPLEILTGGNPRLLTIIARFGAKRSFRDLMENVLDLVDEHTEYFKSHLESLPPQERRVYLALARLWKPSTTRQVADLARVTTNTCSAQLKRLVARGAVTIDGGSPRRRQYYLTERLYNIYYLLRHGVGSDRLVQALIEFMTCLYSASALVQLLHTLNREMRTSDMPTLDASEHLLDALLKQARSLGDDGKTDEAIAICEEIIHELASDPGPSSDKPIASAIRGKILLLFASERRQECISACEELIGRFREQDDKDLALHIAFALGTKGMVLADMDHPSQSQSVLDQALACLSKIKGPVPAFMPPSILQYKGITFLRTSQNKEAVNAFDELLELHKLNPGSVVNDYVPQTIILKAMAMNQMSKAISDYEVSLLLKSLAVENQLLDGSLEALVPYVASVDPSKALSLLQGSPAAPLLLPLTAAVQQELGQTPQVAKEVAEVASDVRNRVSEARARQEEARAQDQVS